METGMKAERRLPERGGAELMPEPDGAGRGRGGVREGPVPGLAKGWP